MIGKDELQRLMKRGSTKQGRTLTEGERYRAEKRAHKIIKSLEKDVIKAAKEGKGELWIVSAMNRAFIDSIYRYLLRHLEKNDLFFEIRSYPMEGSYDDGHHLFVVWDY